MIREDAGERIEFSEMDESAGGRSSAVGRSEDRLRPVERSSRAGVGEGPRASHAGPLGAACGRRTLHWRPEVPLPGTPRRFRTIQAPVSPMDPVELVRAIPYARWIGIDVRRDASGPVTTLRFRDGLIGNRRLPAIHGGVVGALLEMAAIVELVERLGRERVPKPINFNVSYLRTAGPHDCAARGEVVKLGQRVAHVRVIAWQEDPKRPFAAGYGNFLV